MREVTIPILPYWSEHAWDITFRARPPCGESSLDGVGSALSACGREHRKVIPVGPGAGGPPEPCFRSWGGGGWA